MNGNLLMEKVDMFCNTYQALKELPYEWQYSYEGQMVFDILYYQKKQIDAEMEEYGKELAEMQRKNNRKDRRK